MGEAKAIRRMVDAAWSAHTASADPDDGVFRPSLAAAADPDHPRVRGFAEFGLPSSSSLATQDRLGSLEKWRKTLGNSSQ